MGDLWSVSLSWGRGAWQELSWAALLPLQHPGLLPGHRAGGSLIPWEEFWKILLRALSNLPEQLWWSGNSHIGKEILGFAL